MGKCTALLSESEAGEMPGTREQRLCLQSFPLHKCGKGLVLCGNRVGQCWSQKFRNECDLLVKIAKEAPVVCQALGWSLFTDGSLWVPRSPAGGRWGKGFQAVGRHL